jgi:hypothetical protein
MPVHTPGVSTPQQAVVSHPVFVDGDTSDILNTSVISGRSSEFMTPDGLQPSPIYGDGRVGNFLGETSGISDASMDMDE